MSKHIVDTFKDIGIQSMNTPDPFKLSSDFYQWLSHLLRDRESKSCYDLFIPSNSKSSFEYGKGCNHIFSYYFLGEAKSPTLDVYLTPFRDLSDKGDLSRTEGKIENPMLIPVVIQVKNLWRESQSFETLCYYLSREPAPMFFNPERGVGATMHIVFNELFALEQEGTKTLMPYIPEEFLLVESIEALYMPISIWFLLGDEDHMHSHHEGKPEGLSKTLWITRTSEDTHSVINLPSLWNSEGFPASELIPAHTLGAFIMVLFKIDTLREYVYSMVGVEGFQSMNPSDVSLSDDICLMNISYPSNDNDLWKRWSFSSPSSSFTPFDEPVFGKDIVDGRDTGDFLWFISYLLKLPHNAMSSYIRPGFPDKLFSNTNYISYHLWICDPDDVMWGARLILKSLLPLFDVSAQPFVKPFSRAPQFPTDSGYLLSSLKSFNCIYAQFILRNNLHLVHLLPCQAGMEEDITKEKKCQRCVWTLVN